MSLEADIKSDKWYNKTDIKIQHIENITHRNVSNYNTSFRGWINQSTECSINSIHYINLDETWKRKSYIKSSSKSQLQNNWHIVWGTALYNSRSHSSVAIRSVSWQLQHYSYTVSGSTADKQIISDGEFIVRCCCCI